MVPGRASIGRLPGRASERLELFYTLSQKLNSTLEFAELVHIIVDIVETDLGFNEYALSLLAEGVPQGLVETVRKGEPTLSIPLCRKDLVLGVLKLPAPAGGFFVRDDRLFLDAIAGQMAVALDNARLYVKTRELAIRDELTGLFNRRHLDRALRTEWARAMRFGRPLALAMIDIDHFKMFNDTHGHVRGDDILKEIAGLLAAHTREVDTLARYGGEEFVLILPNTGDESARLVGEKLRVLIVQQSPVTVSMGIATYPHHAVSLNDLIDKADSALYDAKRAGRNCVTVCGLSGGQMHTGVRS